MARLPLSSYANLLDPDIVIPATSIVMFLRLGSAEDANEVPADARVPTYLVVSTPESEGSVPTMVLFLDPEVCAESDPGIADRTLLRARQVLAYATEMVRKQAPPTEGGAPALAMILRKDMPWVTLHTYPEAVPSSTDPIAQLDQEQYAVARRLVDRAAMSWGWDPDDAAEGEDPMPDAAIS